VKHHLTSPNTAPTGQRNYGRIRCYPHIATGKAANNA
jgi:hypothetical protein